MRKGQRHRPESIEKMCKPKPEAVKQKISATMKARGPRPQEVRDRISETKRWQREWKRLLATDLDWAERTRRWMGAEPTRLSELTHRVYVRLHQFRRYEEDADGFVREIYSDGTKWPRRTDFEDLEPKEKLRVLSQHVDLTSIDARSWEHPGLPEAGTLRFRWTDGSHWPPAVESTPHG